jgi:hypothetical protein
MIRAKQGKELMVVTLNEIGALSEIAKTLADRGINLLAVSGWVEGQDAVIRLVTEDNLRAMEALRHKNYSIREKDVLLLELPHRPGLLRAITQKLAAEEIDIHHLYATGSATTEKVLVALATSHNDRALVALQSLPR